MQQNLFDRAAKMRAEHTVTIDNVADFRSYFTPKNADQPEIHGGFAMCHFSSEAEVQPLLDELKVTIRCIPIAGDDEGGPCFVTGKPSGKRAGDLRKSKHIRKKAFYLSGARHVRSSHRCQAVEKLSFHLHRLATMATCPPSGDDGYWLNSELLWVFHILIRPRF